MNLRLLVVLGGLLPALACPAESDRPRKDAAEQVKEGDITQWIEYYQANRQPAAKDKNLGDAQMGKTRATPTVLPSAAPSPTNERVDRERE